MNSAEIVLVTGASGFLGSNLVRACLKSGYLVMAYKRRTTDLWRLKDVADCVQWFDVEELDVPFLKNKINHVIHTATSYGRENEKASDLVLTNLLFPLKLYELALTFGVNTFFNTDTVLYKYLNPYALSKKQFSQWLRYLSGTTKVINVELEHLYGPGDDSSKFVSYVIDQCINNVPEIKLTPGEQKRDFIYIEDAVNAYLCLLKNVGQLQSSYSEIALGSGTVTMVKKLVDLIAKITKSNTKLLFGSLPYRENEVMESVADISKLKQLGWSPQYCLDDGIKACIENRR
jgi:nucleoside-diphosphate-sugar epimerase